MILARITKKEDGNILTEKLVGKDCKEVIREVSPMTTEIINKVRNNTKRR